jgi:[FeFe] hydrogenase H-cluster maturation GTPase HydF
MSKGRDNKPHIGIFGRRNVGKSSFINALVGQEIAIVSDQAGTTTDPVKKSIEIFGIGPAIIIDTAGIDDTGELGEKRIFKSMEILKIVDCAILMITENQFGDHERNLISRFNEYNIPHIIVYNKSDIEPLKIQTAENVTESSDAPLLICSLFDPASLNYVVEELKKVIPETAFSKSSLLGDLIVPGDYVLLITPIDKEAPDGRMILPQQMAIRDVLDNNAINIVLKEDQVENFIKNSGIKPRIAITDSQVFHKMKKIIPENIPLTSFSIVFARMKGDFENYKKGTPSLDQLKDGDRVLILESCSHQVNCDDIGRFKLPNWIQKYSGKNIDFEIVAGLSKVERDFKDYALVVQCGGCMVTRKQLSNRLKPAIDAHVPVTNYGLAIAWMNGIFDRAVQPFEQPNG